MHAAGPWLEVTRTEGRQQQHSLLGTSFMQLIEKNIVKIISDEHLAI